MKQVTLNIPDQKYHFFMELIQNLDFIKKVEENNPSKEQIIQNLKDSIEEVKLIKKGTAKGISAKDLLNEL